MGVLCDLSLHNILLMGIFGQERAKMKVLILLLWTIMTIYTSQARYYLVKTATNGDHKMKLKHDDYDDYSMIHDKIKLKHDDDGDYKMKLKHDDHGDYQMRRKPDQDQHQLNPMAMK